MKGIVFFFSIKNMGLKKTPVTRPSSVKHLMWAVHRSNKKAEWWWLHSKCMQEVMSASVGGINRWCQAIGRFKKLLKYTLQIEDADEATLKVCHANKYRLTSNNNFS